MSSALKRSHENTLYLSSKHPHEDRNSSAAKAPRTEFSDADKKSPLHSVYRIPSSSNDSRANHPLVRDLRVGNRDSKTEKKDSHVEARRDSQGAKSEKDLHVDDISNDASQGQLVAPKESADPNLNDASSQEEKDISLLKSAPHSKFSPVPQGHDTHVPVKVQPNQQVMKEQEEHKTNDDEDPLQSMVWMCKDSRGFVKGPYSLNTLKIWSDVNSFDPSFKVWNKNQTQDQSVLLEDVLRQFYSKKEQAKHKKNDDLQSMVWMCKDSRGFVKGPYSLSTLKIWSDVNSFDPSFEVWNKNQTQDQSVLLEDVLKQFYPN